MRGTSSSNCLGSVSLPSSQPELQTHLDECQALHLAVLRALGESNALLLKSLACSIHDRHGKANVAEAPARVAVAVVVALEVGVRLGAPVCGVTD